MICTDCSAELCMCGNCHTQSCEAEQLCKAIPIQSDGEYTKWKKLELIPKEQWEELIRIGRGKSRRSSDCAHEGKIEPIGGCEFCGDPIIEISPDLYKRLTDMSQFEFKDVKLDD